MDAARAQKPRPPKNVALERVTWLYLAIIVLLIVVVVYLAARLVRIHDIAKSMKKQFGLTDLRATNPRTENLRNLSTQQLLEPRTFDQYRNEFNRVLDRAFKLGDFNDKGNVPTTPDAAESTLQKACKQALKGGKRLRPIILMEIARVVSKKMLEKEQLAPIDPADAAIAVECFHAGSLIIDDLPAFDNDSLRRGEPSVWASTSQADALMAAIAIMAGAFQNICRQVDWIRENAPSWVNADRIGTMLCSQMSSSLGIMGAASGQHMDMLSPAQLSDFMNTTGGKDDVVNPTNADDERRRSAVQLLVQRKTSPFFEMAFVSGWLVGGGPPDPETVEELRRAGRDFGTGFQIADDIGDLEKDRARRESGKPGWNYADIYGESGAEVELIRRLNSCKRILTKHGLYTPLWDEIYGKVYKMSLP